MMYLWIFATLFSMLWHIQHDRLYTIQDFYQYLYEVCAGIYDVLTDRQQTRVDTGRKRAAD